MAWAPKPFTPKPFTPKPFTPKPLYGACCVKLYIDFFSLSRAGRDDLRGARDRAPPSRRNLVFGRSARDLDHDARMRIGSEAPRRRTHSHPRLKGHCLGRDTATSD